MNSAEKKKRKKIRISIIDVLIVVTLMACICGSFVHYKIYEKNNQVNTDDVCMVSILFSGVEPSIADKVSSGDTVYLKKDGVVFGTVSEVSFKDALSYYANEEGRIVEGSDSTKKDVTIIVRVVGDMTSRGFLVNGKDYIASGMNEAIYTSKFSGMGLVFDVKQQTE